MKKAILLVLLSTLSVAHAEILKVNIDGIIDPITAEFIDEAVKKAEQQRAELLLIDLSTPGGLGISMQQIIQTMLGSSVPIVCYVTPKGTHAASAGFFILLSADVAAMAPGTNTGAAHPVFPFGSGDKVMLEKIKKDALANLRSIVERRKRNYEMAAKAVEESDSFTAEEALQGGLIDLIAKDEPELLRKLNGRTIRRLTGEAEVLNTTGQQVDVLEMSFRQKLLSQIANPNFALILGLLGLLGLYFEFTHPGMYFPGVLGGICFLLALLGFSLLPVSLIGVLLIILAIGLFIAEVKIQGFGVLGIGGVVAMTLGLLFLINAPYPGVRISLEMALSVTIPFALIFILLLHLVVKSHRARVTTGAAGLLDQVGMARTNISSEGGKVFVNGEWWEAVSPVFIDRGQKIRVVKTEGLKLFVQPEPSTPSQGGESAR